jgi:hypothetical protein
MREKLKTKAQTKWMKKQAESMIWMLLQWTRSSGMMTGKAKRDKEGDQQRQTAREELTSAEDAKQDTALEAEEREGGEIENEGSEEGEQVSRES